MAKVHNFFMDDILSFLNLDRPLSIYDSLPNCCQVKAGNHFFLVEKNGVCSLNDLTRDVFSPWSGNFGSKTFKSNVATKKIFLDGDGKFTTVDVGAPLHLKCIRNTHREVLGFQRNIFYVLNRTELASHVLYVYSSQNDFTHVPTFSSLLLPSESEAIKAALVQRTTKAAHALLLSEGVQVSKKKLCSLSRSVSSHLKSKQGRKAPLNLKKILDRYTTCVNPEELLAVPFIERSDDGNVVVRIMVGYPDAIRCFCSALPTADDLLNHREAVEALRTMSSREAQEYFDSFLSQTSVSGSLPVGACIMLDTTFSLSSSEYVTTVIGCSETFRSKDSGKNASILLGVMIHSSKDKIHHQEMASFLNKLFEKYSGGKKLGVLIHDGEKAFECYSKMPFSQSSVLLRCDVHRFNNLAKKARADDLDPEELKRMLWGSKKKLAGETVSNKGILNCLLKPEYNRRMLQLISSLPDGNVKNWLTSNFDELYESNSIYSKLYGGWPMQYMTSNILEAKNAHFKMIITHKQPGEKVLDDFLRYHKEEMNERMLAAAGFPSKLVVEFPMSLNEWNSKTHTEKRIFLRSYGLEQQVHEFDVPSFLMPGRQTKSEAVFSLLRSLEVHRCESLIFIINKNEKTDCSYVKVKENTLKCFHHSCIKLKTFKFCPHKIIAFSNLLENEKKDVTEREESRLQSLQCEDVLRAQIKPSQGTKTKRKGKQFSRNNGSRRFTRILNDTISSYASTTSLIESLETEEWSRDDY